MIDSRLSSDSWCEVLTGTIYLLGQKIVAGLTIGVIVSSLYGPDAHAQDQLPQHVINPQSLHNVRSVYAADLNGDENMDLLSGSNSGVAWYKNLGGGTFSGKISISSSFSTSVFAADLDGDGDKDVASASPDSNIIWFENTGDSFSNEKVIASHHESFPTSIYLADLKGSGKDVLYSLSNEDAVFWVENIGGDGVFGSPDALNTNAEGAQSVHASNLDGDDDNDVVYASEYDNTISFSWRWKKAGAFIGPNIITSEAQGVQSVTAADLDSDGDRDVISASKGDGKIAWYKTSGEDDSLSFSDQEVIASENGAQSVDAADLDGDGDPDILAASSDKIIAYENRIGESGDNFTSLSLSQENGPSSVYAGDLDSDGDIDALAGTKQDEVAWHENRLDTGEGFTAEKVVVPVPAVKNPSSVYATDLDGDGDSDVLSASRDDGPNSERNGKIIWYENGDEKYFIPKRNIITADAYEANSVYADDLDGDGDKDVISGSEWEPGNEDIVSWYENDGSGDFSSGIGIYDDFSGEVESVYAGDLDGDGDKDVVSASKQIVWHENDGASFNSHNQVNEDIQFFSSVFSADLDGDGDNDIIAASDHFEETNRVIWFKNLGSGSFSSKKVISSNVENVQSVYVEDISGDGSNDVISASRGNDKIAWYLNTGGSFSEQKVVDNNAVGTESVSTGDFDSDGDADIVASTINKVKVYENSTSFGSTSFSLWNSANTGSKSVSTSDLDGDNDQDIVSAVDPTDTESIIWLENTSKVLPVEMSGLKVRNTKNTAIISWETATENNNAGFSIHHQPPKSQDWTDIGFVESKAEGGSTTETKTYEFVEENLSVGTHRFRLEQVDLDGTSTLTDPVSVEVEMRESLMLTAPVPNPVNRSSTFSFAVKDAVETTVALYDMLGRRVKTLYEDTPTAGQSQHLRLNARDLSSGIYMLRLQTDEKTRTRRVTIIR